MTVLVTGGSGVVGGAVVDHLVEAGREVRALVRSETAAGIVAAKGAQPVRGDILDVASVEEASRGCEVVFHVAGLNDMCLTDPAPLFRANVAGARNVLGAAEAAGVRRLVYTSSAATLGEPKGAVGDEDIHRSRSYLSAYERSKHEGELVMTRTSTQVEVVSVNPSSVQGPGRASGTAKLLLDLINGKLPALVDTRMSLVDIDDCARGHLLAELHGVPGRRYVLSGFTLTTAEALDLLGAVTGLSIKPPILPAGIATAGAAAVEGFSRLLGRRPPVCREMIRVMSFGHAYDGSRATRELGLTYASPEATLRRAVAWFVAEGLIKRRLPAFG